MSKFLRIKCECGHEQNIFGNAASKIKCASCGKVVAEPSGGRANIKAKIVKVLD